MRTAVLWSILAFSALAGPGPRPASAAPYPPVAPWGPAAVQACQLATSGPCTISTITRRYLTSDVAELSFTMKIGPGVRDVIGLHRVIRDEGILPRPNIAPTFFVHGDLLGFDAAFMASAASPSTPDSHALPVYLAQRGIDVWGIDMRWILVPPGTNSFGFMANWGLNLNASDVGVGMAIAAGARGSSAKFDLLGWSRGGQIAYTYLSNEAALPPAQRRVNSFIPVDIYARVDDPTLRQYACNRQAERDAQIANGQFADGSGQLLSALGLLASSSPNAVSPFSQTGPNGEPPLFPPGTTNRQAALLLGTVTFNLLAPNPPNATYHWVGGSFDVNTGFPTGLNFTNETLFFNYLSGLSPFESNRLIADAEAMMCEQDPTTFLANLANVNVPVLYVGVDGGFGTTGIFSTTLLGGADKEIQIVDLLPAPQQVSDFGHSDLFLAANAEALVWEPIYNWILGWRLQ